MAESTRRAMSAFDRDTALAREYARAYAGEEGSIATLPDIVEGRLGSVDTAGSDMLWQNTYTTGSSIFRGVGEDGREKLIVVHGDGIGPLATREALEEAYGRKSEQSRTRGFVSLNEFRKLEKGEYGEVQQIGPEDPVSQLTEESRITMLDQREYAARMDDLMKKSIQTYRSLEEMKGYLERSGGCWDLEYDCYRYLKHRDQDIIYTDYTGAYPGGSIMFTAEQAAQNALVMMQLGTRGRDYVMVQEQWAKQYYTAGMMPRSLKLSRDLGYKYDSRDEERIPEGMAIARTIGLGALTRSVDMNGNVLDVSAKVYTDPLGFGNFIGIPKGAALSGELNELPTPKDIIAFNSKSLLRPTDEGEAGPLLPVRLRSAQDGTVFTRYSSREDNTSIQRDERDMEFPVTKAVKVGGPRVITVDAPFFLEYALADLKAVQPKSANAYMIEHVGDKQGDGASEVTVQFYKAAIDTSQRLPRPEELAEDFDALMKAGGIDRG